MIGMAATTKLLTKEHKPGHWEARQGFSLLGSTNMSDEAMQACNNDPFHSEWCDNYHWGMGDSEQAAIDDLKVKAADTGESLWR